MDQIKMQVIVMEACSLHGRDEKKKNAGVGDGVGRLIAR
jgi:hypothetical protein